LAPDGRRAARETVGRRCVRTRLTPASRVAPLAACAWAFAALLVLVAAGAAAAADLEAGRKKAEVCAACHGADGNATIPGMPSLAGQPVYFTHWQLIKFRDGRRKDPQMTPFAVNLSDADMGDLAAYYQAQTGRPRPAETDPARVAAGRQLADQFHCSSCHRPGFVGQQQAARLAGQDSAYLLRLLRGFRAKTASDLDGTMTTATQGLTDDDIVSIVQYLATLP